jgi:FixJ family two-component response regulator
MSKNRDTNDDTPSIIRIVHIVDTDSSMCERLSILFRLEGFRTGFSTSLEMFVAAGIRREFDIVVANLHLGSASGLDLLHQLRINHANATAIMITGTQDVALAVEAMKMGATEVLGFPLDTGRLLAAARSHRSAGVSLSAKEMPNARPLTDRERQVMELIVGGYSTKEMAQKLGISGRTVEVYRRAVMQKVGARNIADLVRMVLDR